METMFGLLIHKCKEPDQGIARSDCFSRFFLLFRNFVRISREKKNIPVFHCLCGATLGMAVHAKEALSDGKKTWNHVRGIQVRAG
jgi:hypothetical protein